MEYRREIDGLRALAVIPVIFFHAGFQGFSGGFVGVDVFFVISGYLITSIILADLKKGRFSIVNFYERRARRILPALFLVMIVCLPFAWFWLLPHDMKRFSQSLVAVSTFASNIMFWKTSGYFENAAEMKPLLHTWSLAVEEQYYLFFPVILILAWKYGKQALIYVLAIIFVISILVAEWGSMEMPSAAFYLLPARGWELLTGAFLAIYLSDYSYKSLHKGVCEAGGIAGVCLIVFAIVSFDKQTPFPGVYALIPTIGAALVILCARRETVLGRFLGNGLFVGTGLISYSAYLWHQPLFAFARHRSLYEPDKITLAALSVMSIVLAYFSWRYVEVPFRKKNIIDRKTIFSTGLVFSVAFVLIGLIGHINMGFPSRFPQQQVALLNDMRDEMATRTHCVDDGVTRNISRNACILGNSTNIAGALLGDSHAYAISDALVRELDRSDLGFIRFAYNGCPPVSGIYRVDAKDDHKCFEHNKLAMEYVLANDQIEHVVLTARWALYLEKTRFDNEEGGVEKGGDAYIDAVGDGVKIVNEEPARRKVVKEKYRNTIEKYLRSDKKVILVYPVPEVGLDVPSFLTKKRIFDGAPNEYNLTTSYDVFKSRNKEIIELFDSISDRENLIRIRPDELLCDNQIQGRCVTVIDDDVLYSDDNHLSNAGAKLVVEMMQDALPM